MVIFLRNVFPALMMNFFWQKRQKTLNVGKIRKYEEEKVFFFEEKTLSSFKHASSPNWEYPVILGGIRLFCIYLAPILILYLFFHKKSTL